MTSLGGHLVEPLNGPAPPNDRERPSYYWGRLPAEISINIFKYCDVQSLGNLLVVSKAFYCIIKAHESDITKGYLRVRRDGTLPSRNNPPRAYTWIPEEDMTVLTDLHPPPFIDQDGQHGSPESYSFRYLADIERRQEICTDLGEYLADDVMNRFVSEKRDIASHFFELSDRAQKRILASGLARLKPKFTTAMLYVMYLLESYQQGWMKDPGTNSQVALLESIVQASPFTDDRTLVTTDHFLTLLLGIPYRLLGELSLYSMQLRWVGLLFASNGLGQIMEFIAAVNKGSSQRVIQKQFRRNMKIDIKYFEKAMETHKSVNLPNIDLYWRTVVCTVLLKRKLLPHPSEDHIRLWKDIHVGVECLSCSTPTPVNRYTYGMW
ncbi:hypothetical protein FQN57_006130 [Myotisia sp. PD_48]|nr:hypothetical protein FQN57_006130 [Myotisia sp. PD_48]